jgi:hypothetical protein
VLPDQIAAVDRVGEHGGTTAGMVQLRADEGA